ncbi:MAG: hypothetical protein U0T84_08375 [Chitinophagales bacterium]
MNDFYSYNTATNTWSAIAPLPGVGRNGAVAFTAGSKGYVGSGYNVSYLNDFYKYNPATNTWSTIDTVPILRADAVAFSINGKGYVGIGGNYFGYLDDFYEYDTLADSWTSRATFPGGQVNEAAGFAISATGKGYVGLGGQSIAGSASFWEFDPTLNAWSSIASFPGGGRSNPFSFSTSAKGYVGNGKTAPGFGFFQDFYEYTPAGSCPITTNTLTAPSSPVCALFSGTTIVGSAAVPGPGAYLWQRDNGSGFGPAPGTNNTQNYSTGNLVAGIYHFRRIYTTTSGTICSDTSAVVSLLVNPKPSAGVDQTVSCVTLPGGSATMAASGTGTWTAQAGNPGTVTITTTSSPTTSISAFSAVGTYNFIWTNGSCSDTASVVVTAKPNAGPDRAASCVTLPGGSATMAASGTGTWTAQAGNPGTATITTTSSPTTTITSFSAVGSYNFIWTNGSCSDTASVVVTAKPDAGADQTVSCVTLPGGSATMAASGTGTWVAQAGNPGTATITTTSSPTTTITSFSAVGSYNFIWTNGSCSDTASVVVTANPDAGADQTVSCVTLPGGSAIMAASGTGTWVAQAGNPGTATITTTSSPATTITSFSAVGSYNFIWTNGSCSDTASVVVTANPDAGADQTVSCFSSGTATMAASGSGSWTVGAGSAGTATIVNATNASTLVSGFSASGVYYLIWSNGACADTALVTANNSCSCPITTNTLTAPTSPVCGPFSGTTINGTAAAPGSGDYLWQLDNGSGYAAAPGTNNNQNYSTGSLTAGTYNFRRIYSTTSGIICSDTSGVVSLVVNPAPNSPTITGVTSGCGSVSLTATGGGSYNWSGGSATTSANNTFSVGGTYTVTVTDANNCTASASAAVTINTVPTANITGAATGCGSVSLTATGGGSYNWSGGSATTSANNTFSAGGTYTVTVTAANSCTATASVLVTITGNPTFVVSSTTNPSACGATDGSLLLTGLSNNAGYAVVYTKNGTLQPTVNFTSNGTGQLSLTGLGAGAYTSIVVSLGSCSSAPSTGTSTLSDPSAPVAPTVGSNSPVCEGGTISLTASGAGSGFNWTGPNAFSSTTQNPSITSATVAGGGSYCATQTVSGCTSPPACVTVTITPANTASAASATPSLCVNTPLTAITHITTGATGIGTPTGLPSGVTAAWASNTITISGIPTTAGIFNYSIPLTSGCGTVNATGTITVNSGPSAFTVTGGGAYCSGDAGLPVGLSGSQTGVSYQLQYNSVAVGSTITGTGSAISFPQQASPGTYTIVATSSSGCKLLMSGVSTISIFNCGVSISDPCSCKNNASNLTDGQFNETVSVTAPSDQNWRVCEVTGLYKTSSAAPPTAPTPIALGDLMTETPTGSGNYEIHGIHIDAVGYTIRVTNGYDTLGIGNRCYYPNPQITDLSPAYLTTDPVITLKGSAELGGAPGGSAPGTGSFTIDAAPATTLDPAALDAGTYQVEYSFDADDLVPTIKHPGCIQTVKQTVTINKKEVLKIPVLITPNNADGINDNLTIETNLNQSDATWMIKDVRQVDIFNGSGPVDWSGKTMGGDRVPNGEYTLFLTIGGKQFAHTFTVK